MTDLQRCREEQALAAKRCAWLRSELRCAEQWLIDQIGEDLAICERDKFIAAEFRVLRGEVAK